MPCIMTMRNPYSIDHEERDRALFVSMRGEKCFLFETRKVNDKKRLKKYF